MCLKAESPAMTILYNTLYYLEALSVYLYRVLLDIARLYVEVMKTFLQFIIHLQVLSAVYYLQLITSSLLYGNIWV